MLAPRPLPRLPVNDTRVESGSKERVTTTKRRRDDTDKTTKDVYVETSTPKSNPFTIAAGTSKPTVGSPQPRHRNAKDAPRLPPGDYVLPDTESFLRYEPGLLAAKCTDEMYDALWNLSHSIPPTPNPLNRTVHLKRKQGTFGASYRFGAQVSKRMDGESGLFPGTYASENDWPALVKLCVLDAREKVCEGALCKQRKECYATSDTFNYKVGTAVAHVNWYPDGTSGMGRHSDGEPSLLPDAPIFSYSFYGRGLKSPSRLFDLYEKVAGVKVNDNVKPFATVPLSHGDCLVMAGAFQRNYEHSVKASAAKKHVGQTRINITVRAFQSEKE